MAKYRKQQHQSKKEFKQLRTERRKKIDAKRHAASHRAPMEQREGMGHNSVLGHERFPAHHVVEGTIRVSSKGVGYVEIEGMKEDIEIDPAHLNTALDQDRVKIVLHGKVIGARQSGEVTQVLFRNKTRFVGVIDREDGTFLLIADDPRMYRPILIPKQKLRGAQKGEKVFVEMTHWSDPKKEPLGEVLQVLGKADTHEVEMQAIVLERGFSTAFDPDVITEAEKIPVEISREEIARRRDMRNTLTFTIDPKDAKDFDDALSFKKLPDLPAPRPGLCFIYAILCSDNSIYIGQTEDLVKRWSEHCGGTGADYTKKYLPTEIIHYEEYDSREKAVEREKWLKTGFGRKWLKREWRAGRTRQAGGNFEVGIHIADVSHYVTPGERIDKEALERGTSIYLVDRTIPMLPERLSNNICSLVPDLDRLTFSVIFTMNKRGDVLDEWFGRTVIHSAKRFTYEEAQAVIDTGKGPHLDALTTLNNMAKLIRDRRIKAGAIAFEADEVKFELDKNGKPIRVYRKLIQDTNKLIEEFMLLANKHVARLIATKDKRAESVFVYRVHDLPNEERMQDLRDFLEGIGYHLKLDKHGMVSSANINRMLEEVRGRAEEAMIQMATVRSMAKAVYTTKNIGHFGLGFEYYTHFTSPIRRYPDLMVHRLLQSYLEGKPVSKKALEHEERLARYCSQMEVQATEAERASIKYKQCEYFAERIGYELQGTISGVTEWGIYVEDPETKAEGMVHVRDIPNDFYFFEQKNYRIVGKNKHKSYRLGDKVRVKIATVDLKRKLIGMKLV